MNEYVVLFGTNNNRMVVTARSRFHARLVAQDILGDTVDIIVMDHDGQHPTAPYGALLQLVGAR